MSDPLFIIILFILLMTVVAAFIRDRKKVRCLKAFRGFTVTLEDDIILLSKHTVVRHLAE